MANTQQTESEGIAVTVYNQGSALVRDKRTFTFEAGLNTLNFTNVAASIDATSVTFKSLTDPQGTRVLEQNYVYDLVDGSALLNRYLDQPIQVTTEDGTVYTGILLSGRGGEMIMQSDQGRVLMITLSRIRDIQFPALPDGLITRPTLRWLLQSAQSGANQVEITYLTYNMSWTADYNVLLSSDGTTLDLSGWITLSNTSGTSYNNAQVKLIAGDVQRIPEPAMRSARLKTMSFAAAEPQVAQRNFSEYKLYEIARPVTISNNETKQVEFVMVASVLARTYYAYKMPFAFYGYYEIQTDQYYGSQGDNVPIQNHLEFTTGKASGLDAALPAGRMRVFQQDVDDAALLIGESSINHTAKGETIDIHLGNAFDLVGERKQTTFHIVAGSVIQEGYEIRLRNRKEVGDVEIRVQERLFRWSNWQILNSSLPYEKVSSSLIEFRPTVKAGEEVVITYTVQYTWPK